MCRLYGLTRQGFCAWRSRPDSARTRQDWHLASRIRALYSASRGTYGSPRIHQMLRREGTRIGRKRVERLMRWLQIKGRSADLPEESSVAEILLRHSKPQPGCGVDPAEPGVAWRHLVSEGWASLELSGGGLGQILPAGGGLEVRSAQGPGADHGRIQPGRGRATTGPRPDLSYGSRHRVRGSGVSRPTGRTWLHSEHEPSSGQNGGQRLHGIVLPFHEGRRGPWDDVQGWSKRGRLR